MKKKKVTHVAIRYQGMIYSLTRPNRHSDVLKSIVTITGISHIDGQEEGFLDEDGNFLNRQEALINALVNDQVKDITKIRMSMLFSEDLW